MVRPALRNNCSRSTWVATREPLPGSASPIASVRQFIELAVNIPEHEPQVGQAASSSDSRAHPAPEESAAAPIESIRSSLRTPEAPSAVAMAFPASIGPPDTNTVGMLSRIAAISIPGVILSQLDTQISASAQCALIMYSTESASSARDGRE